MKYCTSCGSVIPDNQGSDSCSMCYGDIGHGRDGYYADWMEEELRREIAIDQMEGGDGNPQDYGDSN